jgi:rod shape determining protein RodA
MAQHLFLVTLFMEDTYEKQLIFIVLTIPLIFIVLSVDGKFYEKYATIIFGISC